MRIQFSPLKPRGMCAVCESMFVYVRQAARRASLAQGAGLLRAAQAMFPLGEFSGVIVSEFRALVREDAAFQGLEVPRIFF